MQTLNVELETLGHLIPDLSTEFAKQLKQLVKSCREASSDPRNRTLTIKVIVKPHPNEPEDVMLTATVGSKSPAKELEVVRARTSRTCQLQFDFDSRDAA